MRPLVFIIFTLSINCYFNSEKQVKKEDVLVKNKEAIIFCFHDINGKGKYSIKKQELIKILLYLKKLNFKVTSLKNWHKTKVENEKVAVLTFDDGYTSVLNIVTPLLVKYKMGATFFIYKDRHNHNEKFYDRLRDLPDFLEIGSHSISHGDLVQTNKNNSIQFFKELVHSKKYLELLLGYEIISFAWPYGKYKKSLVEQVFKAGYKYQVSTEYRIANKLEKIHPRYTVSSPNAFKNFKKYIQFLKK